MWLFQAAFAWAWSRSKTEGLLSFFMLSYTNFLLRPVVSFAEQPTSRWRISQFYRSLPSQFRSKNLKTIDLKTRTHDHFSLSKRHQFVMQCAISGINDAWEHPPEGSNWNQKLKFAKLVSRCRLASTPKHNNSTFFIRCFFFPEGRTFLNRFVS